MPSLLMLPARISVSRRLGLQPRFTTAFPPLLAVEFCVAMSVFSCTIDTAKHAAAPIALQRLANADVRSTDWTKALCLCAVVDINVAVREILPIGWHCRLRPSLKSVAAGRLSSWHSETQWVVPPRSRRGDFRRSVVRLP